MSENKAVSPMAIAVTLLMYAFYVAIMLYIMLGMRGIRSYDNFAPAALFEGIGFVIGAFVMFARTFSAKLDIGYYIPVIGVTLIYTVALHVLCVIALGFFSQTFFVLINALLLFAWCAVCLPMVLMGGKKR